MVSVNFKPTNFLIFSYAVAVMEIEGATAGSSTESIHFLKTPQASRGGLRKRKKSYAKAQILASRAEILPFRA